MTWKHNMRLMVICFLHLVQVSSTGRFKTESHHPFGLCNEVLQGLFKARPPIFNENSLETKLVFRECIDKSVMCGVFF